MNTILVVEDDPAILSGLAQHLSDQGYSVVTATNGQQGLDEACSRRPDLIVLDVMLPGLSGFQVCQQLRKKNVASKILMLTARGDELDRVTGLDLGADDYVSKPFSLGELCARIRALLRRGNPLEGETVLGTIRFGSVAVNFLNYEVRRRGVLVNLTRKEMDLLQYMCAKQGQVLSREDLMEQVWGMDVFPTMRTVDNHVAHLRAKLEDDPARPVHFLTVHGVGYRFVPDSA